MNLQFGYVAQRSRSTGVGALPKEKRDDVLVSPVCAGMQADVTNAKLNKISARRNDFTLPSWH
jgi:hypothetical protein